MAQSSEELFSQCVVELSALAIGSKDADLIVKFATLLDLQNKDVDTRARLKALTRSEKTENIRFFVPIVAPLVSAVALVAAFVFQTYQFKENTRIQNTTVEIQRDTALIQSRAAEDAQWRQVATTLTASPSGLTGMTANALLIPFLKVGPHLDEARTIATYLLPATINFDGFSSLFLAVLGVTEESKKKQLCAHVAQELLDTYNQVEEDKSNVHGSVNARLATLPNDKGERVPNPYWVSSQLDRQVKLVASALVDLLRSKELQASERLDLSNGAFWDTDWSNVRFGAADVSSSSFFNCDLKDSDLGEIAAFDASNWNRTAWWRAIKISPPLLSYLEKNYRYRSGVVYAGASASVEEYQLSVGRLRAN